VALQAQGRGEGHAEDLSVDVGLIDFEKLRDEFASRVHRKHAALQAIGGYPDNRRARFPTAMISFRPVWSSATACARKSLACVKLARRRRDRVEAGTRNLAQAATNLAMRDTSRVVDKHGLAGSEQTGGL
jgi:hypothetical protein